MMTIDKKLIPALRFPQFSGKWEVKRIEKVAEINPKAKPLPDKFIYIDLESVSQNILLKKSEILKVDAPSRAIRTLEPGDILYQTVRPYQKNNLLFTLTDSSYVASSGYAQLRCFQHTQFVYQFLHTNNLVNKVIRMCTGTSYPAISSSDLASLPINLPTLPEQEKIASFLSSIDRKVELLKAKKEQLEQYKKGMMQQLFAQTIRFKDQNGKQFPEWQEKRLGEIADRVSTKNILLNDNVLTISGQLGLVNQLEYFNNAVSSKNTQAYTFLEKNDFAYNKSYSKGYPLGAIKRLIKYNNGVVSPLYICFRLKSLVQTEFIEQLFEAGVQNKAIYMVAQEGARNHGLLNIAIGDFFSIKINLPSLPEQQKIADFLSAIDRKIEGVGQQMAQTELFKKAMLQQLFV